MTDLVEKVARAMAEASGAKWPHDANRYRTLARAVIPLVREDCAKVADEAAAAYRKCTDLIPESLALEATIETAEIIAASIRQLATALRGPGEGTE